MGHHGHYAAEISSVVHCVLHNVLTNGATTNADHDTARHLLVRIGIFQSLRLLGQSPGVHVPDLTIGEQVFDLVNLLCFCSLYPALSAHSYHNILNRKLLMHEERFAEMLYSWLVIGRLIQFIDEKMQCSIVGNYSSFAEIIQVSPLCITSLFAC
jgi:hypothetical protein